MNLMSLRRKECTDVRLAHRREPPILGSNFPRFVLVFGEDGTKTLEHSYSIAAVIVGLCAVNFSAYGPHPSMCLPWLSTSLVPVPGGLQ